MTTRRKQQTTRPDLTMTPEKLAKIKNEDFARMGSKHRVPTSGVPVPTKMENQ